MITKETTIEDLVRILPEAVNYLMEKGIRCLACGEPLWGTVEEAAASKGYSPHQIEEIVADLSNLLAAKREG
jgi:methionine synthase II (cobalamin-independent)